MRPAILISSGAEWRAVLAAFPGAQLRQSPFGDWFETALDGLPRAGFFRGGWGKISAAASAQWVIDAWRPGLLANLGTCGGFAGHIERGEVILAQGALAYDIQERMGNQAQALAFYTTPLDLAWLREPYPHPVRRAWMVSADRDLCPEDIPMLAAQYGALAADWESAAIAWVAQRNGLPCLILRGVSDLVGEDGGEAYDDIEVFRSGAWHVITRLVAALPAWLRCVDTSVKNSQV